MFVAGMVRDASGQERDAETRNKRAEVASEVRTEGGRTRILPVGLVEDGDDTLLAYSVDKGSGATTSLTRADGYVTVEPSRNYLGAGEDVEVSLFGGASPPALLGAGERDTLLNRLIEGRDTRWLPIGSVEGARRLRDGIVDVAAVGLSPDEIDSLGVESARLLRGYDRQVGYVGDTDGGVFGVVPDGYTLREGFNDEGADTKTLVFRSEEGAANAVVSGKVDAAFVGEDTASTYDLSFEPAGWVAVDFLVEDGRHAKEGVRSFLSALEDAPSPTGYRKPNDSSEVVERWD